MARLRRTPRILVTARQCLAGLKSIMLPPTLDPTVTLSAYDASTASFVQKLWSYDEAVAAVDKLQNDLEAHEDHLREFGTNEYFQR